MIEIPIDVQKIIDTLENVGFEAYIVGGCVRDAIRGESPKDWDIATSALPAQVKALFLRTIDTGLKHGTVTVLQNRQRYEVTTYRIDGEYLDSRRPETVTFAKKIEEDLSRRDFTVNAIAYSPKRGFADPFNGREDIKRGLIKCVGNAKSRFNEDALRMLRAIRFAAVLGFDVDESALQAASELKETLANISAERIREELCKLIGGKNIDAAKLLHTTGLMYFALRNREFGGDLNKIISWLQTGESILDEPMRLALFFSWAGEEITEILRDLRFDNKTIKTLSLYVQFLPAGLPQTRYEIKKFLRIMPPEIFENLLTLKEISRNENVEKIRIETRDIIEKNECFNLKNLAVNGDDLSAAGIADGKDIGKTLEKLLDAVMRDPSTNTKEALLCQIR
jgi:tRNA nucleotidyltransferase (CCA-adding enzyme)